MTTATQRTPGRDLAAGDTILILGRRERIIGFRPYTGPLQCLTERNARIAVLDVLEGGITVCDTDVFDRVVCG